MHRVELTTEEKERLEFRHRKTADMSESDRIKAILLRSEGWSITQIAQALRRHEASITRYLKDYLKHQKLTVNSGGSSSKLSAQQRQALIAHLTEHTYAHNHQIVQYVKARFGAEFSVSGLHKWLRCNGFVYKQRKGIPAKCDEQKQAQAQFIAEYPKLKNTIGDDEQIVFCDATHPTQATKLSHGWIRKGQDKWVNTSGSRTRINLIGSLAVGQAKQVFVKRVNAEVFCEYLVEMRAHFSSAKTLHLILDGAGYHIAGAVAEQAKELKIKLHFLPPYSPNLNPIERLWKVMNEQVRNNRFFTSAAHFRQEIDHFFQDTLPNMEQNLDRTINDNFQLLKPAFPSRLGIYPSYLEMPDFRVYHERQSKASCEGNDPGQSH